MKNIINLHKKKYPLMMEVDIYKLLYQGEFGVEHNITDIDISFEKLIEEFASIDQNTFQDLYEEISDQFVRVNLIPYKNHKLDIKVLFDAFIKSNHIGDNEVFINKLKDANLDPINIGAVHHSKIYHENYNPHYRIIKKEYLTDQMKLVQVFNFLSNIKGKSIIALEGKCGSGKTTLASKIANILPVTIINVDDFFLPKHRKTKARLNEVGGNIDYERIYDLLEKITKNELIKYEKFNCSNGQYEPKNFINNNIIILEGVYSYHKIFRHFINYLIYIDVDNFTQNNRLMSRSNYSRFIEEWIPLENTYFESDNIKYLADIMV